MARLFREAYLSGVQRRPSGFRRARTVKEGSKTRGSAVSRLTRRQQDGLFAAGFRSRFNLSAMRLSRLLLASVRRRLLPPDRSLTDDDGRRGTNETSTTSVTFRRPDHASPPLSPIHNPSTMEQLREIVNDYLLANLPSDATDDSNVFREACLYTQDVDNTFRVNHSPLGGEPRSP